MLEKENPQLAKFQAKQKCQEIHKSVFSLVFEMRSAIISGWENNLVTKVRKTMCDVERNNWLLAMKL